MPTSLKTDGRTRAACSEFDKTRQLKFIEPSFDDGRNYTEVHLKDRRLRVSTFDSNGKCLACGEWQDCDPREIIKRFSDWLFV